VFKGQPQGGRHHHDIHVGIAPGSQGDLDDNRKIDGHEVLPAGAERHEKRFEVQHLLEVLPRPSAAAMDDDLDKDRRIHDQPEAASVLFLLPGFALKLIAPISTWPA